MRNITINIRAQQSQLELIDQAAELLGKNRSEFILEASCQKAQEVLLSRRFFSLSQEQWDKFLSALDAPVQVNNQIQQLLNTTYPWET